MKIKYSEKEFFNAMADVLNAENTDAFPAYIWARYAKIFADIIDGFGGEMLGKVVKELAEDYGGHA